MQLAGSLCCGRPFNGACAYSSSLLILPILLTCAHKHFTSPTMLSAVSSFRCEVVASEFGMDPHIEVSEFRENASSLTRFEFSGTHPSLGSESSTSSTLTIQISHKAVVVLNFSIQFEPCWALLELSFNVSKFAVSDRLRPGRLQSCYSPQYP